MKPCALPALTLGGTSFLLPADYVPALRFAAPRCDDVALLMLECGPQGEQLLSPQDVTQAAAILKEANTRLHVHLPTEADCSTARSTRRLMHAVRLAVERAMPLAPHSFVLHVDFACLRRATRAAPSDLLTPDRLTAEQRYRTRDALDEMAALLPHPEQLAIENLEGFHPDFWDCWLEDRPFSRCCDIGHIWKDNGDPVPWLERWLPRLRVIHLHGLRPRHTTQLPDAGAHDLQRRFGPQPRDHASLEHMPAARIDAVMHLLWDRRYAGVLTLEVFSYDDFLRSHAVLRQSWERYPRKEAVSCSCRT